MQVDRIARDVTRGFEGRLLGLETPMSAMEAWSADTSTRLERIERRLGLVEAPPA